MGHSMYIHGLTPVLAPCNRLSYSGPGKSFAVDWNFFDRGMLYEVVMATPGFRVHEEPALNIDWEITSERMIRFHG